MKILFLAHLYPYPPACGGTIRSWNVLKHLAAKHDVTLASFVRGESQTSAGEGPESVCRAVHTIQIRRSGLLNTRFAIESLIRREPFIILRDYVVGMQRLLDGLTAREDFDLLYVDHLQMAQYAKPHYARRLVLDEHNVEWRIVRRVAATAGGPKRLFAELEWRKLRAYELAACARFDRVITVTEEDRRALTEDGASLEGLSTVPIGVDLKAFERVSMSPESRAIISIGTMSWPPNIDSILYFVREIYPLVKRREPDVTLIIAGSNPPESIRRLYVQDPSITVTGFVPDLSAIAAQAAIFIVPLRSGSGMRVKILNALAMGLPVVSTSVGCEGIDAVNGRDLLIADTPGEFAVAVERLLNDCGERLALAERGRRFVEDNYSWESILPRLDAVLEQTVDETIMRQAGLDRPPIAGIHSPFTPPS